MQLPLRQSPARRWIGFVLICLGMFMAILDVQIVAAALPTMRDALRIQLDQLSWIQTAYLIAEVIAVAFSGRLARALSTIGLFTWASAGFTLASLACAFSHDFTALIVARSVQGLCGGAIIPTAFTTGFRLFPGPGRSRALLLAGSFAMLAPSLGPLLGGFITERLSWSWLFLINVPTGIVVAASVALLLAIDEPDRSAWHDIDLVAVAGLACALGLLMVALKVAPQDHWTNWRDAALLAGVLIAGSIGIRRCVAGAKPLVDLSALRERSFAAACALNFLLGCGLYGSVYVLPLYLGFVRHHDALAIGIIMTVTGAAELIAAPFATLLERYLAPMWVAGTGFALFAAGSLLNGYETPRADATELFWPQVLRGAAALFCLLPITTAALGQQPAWRLADASALLNVMRNLGGAIGIALVDTLITLRPPEIGTHLAARLQAGDRATAAFVG